MLAINALPSSAQNTNRTRELEAQHERCLSMKEAFWHQRSRIQLALLGDRNTGFFHASAVVRHQRNLIISIEVDGLGRVTDEAQIRRAFISHFKEIYTKGPRVQVQSAFTAQFLQALPKIPLIVHDHLESIPSDSVIQRTLFVLGPHESAGPDGFNSKVVQDNWNIFGDSILTEVRSFFSTGHMPPSIAKSNLVLVPKVEEPKLVTDFRPISVCNVVYKVVSKF